MSSVRAIGKTDLAHEGLDVDTFESVAQGTLGDGRGVQDDGVHWDTALVEDDSGHSFGVDFGFQRRFGG